MAAKNMKRALSVIAASLLVVAPCRILYGYQDQASPPAPDTGNPTDAAPQSASQLQALVAPIALYPDALVAQILSASTFPDQVAIADYWLGQNKNLTGNALMKAVDRQTWDPSVKALTQFPSVLGNLAKNLSWTSSLGEAYHNQPADVMTAIQTLREQAKAKGTLKSNSQITVVQKSPQVIVIEPANPQVVYVPEYDPALVYGVPYVVPGYVAPVYTAGDVAAAGLIGFGAGIAVGALMGGGCCSWGWSSWNCGWHGGAVVYHGGAYYGNTAWHGGYYNGGYHNGYGYNNSFNHNNYRNSGNTYNRNTNFNRNVNRSGGSNTWAQHTGDGMRSNAFSGLSGHSGGWGGSSGWSARANSSRGWGSMRSSGFGGGRFGGGFGGVRGGFGGGRFGGGFRR
jgi:Protein of unknown function (DUF3300)